MGQKWNKEGCKLQFVHLSIYFTGTISKIVLNNGDGLTQTKTSGEAITEIIITSELAIDLGNKCQTHATFLSGSPLRNSNFFLRFFSHLYH